MVKLARERVCMGESGSARGDARSGRPTRRVSHPRAHKTRIAWLGQRTGVRYAFITFDVMGERAFSVWRGVRQRECALGGARQKRKHSIGRQQQPIPLLDPPSLDRATRLSPSRRPFPLLPQANHAYIRTSTALARTYRRVISWSSNTSRLTRSALECCARSPEENDRRASIFFTSSKHLRLTTPKLESSTIEITESIAST